MKKTLVLFVLGLAVAAAQAATNTTYWAGNTGNDLLEYSSANGGTFPYLSNATATARLPFTEKSTLTTEDDTTYTLVFNTTGDISFRLNEAIYLNSVTVGADKPSSYTINLCEKGSITTAQEFNIGQREPRAAVTLSASFETAIMTSIDADVRGLVQSVYSRDLLVAKGHDGFWNLSDSFNNGTLTFSSDALAATGLTYAGFVATDDDIHFGEYGIVYTEAGGTTEGSGAERMTLVVKTPEPATATLSLLALAALASRRKRH